MLLRSIDFLLSNITNIKGVGIQTQILLDKLLGNKRIIDLLLHKPIAVNDRRNSPDISLIKSGQTVTFVLTIGKHISPSSGYKSKSPYKVICYSENKPINIIFFSKNIQYIKQKLPIGSKKVISGKADIYNGEISIAHPDYIEEVSKLSDIKKIEVIYPLKHGLYNKQISKFIKYALEKIQNPDEWLDNTIIKREGWINWKDSLQQIHNPKSCEDINIDSSWALGAETLCLSGVKIYP